MAYIIAKPAKDAEEYSPPVLTEARQKEIEEQRNRVIRYRKRKRERTRPQHGGKPAGGTEPEWKDNSWLWTTEINGKGVFCWDEITEQWMDKNTFWESMSRFSTPIVKVG